MLAALIIAVVAVVVLVIVLAVAGKRLSDLRSDFKVYEATHLITEDEHQRIVKAKSDAAVKQSKSTRDGQEAEVFAPWIAGFEYQPADTFHLGGTVDLIVFDGLSEDYVRDVVFVEIKTGRNDLEKRQKLVREAVEAKRVKFRQVRLNRESDGSAPAAKTVRRNRPIEIKDVLPSPVRRVEINAEDVDTA